MGERGSGPHAGLGHTGDPPRLNPSREFLHGALGGKMSFSSAPPMVPPGKSWLHLPGSCRDLSWRVPRPGSGQSGGSGSAPPRPACCCSAEVAELLSVYFLFFPQPLHFETPYLSQGSAAWHPIRAEVFAPHVPLVWFRCPHLGLLKKPALHKAPAPCHPPCPTGTAPHQQRAGFLKPLSRG